MKRLLPILIFTLFFSVFKSQTSTIGPTVTPNPFIDRTLITYSVPLADTASIKIISQIGQIVLTVFSNSFIPAGLHQDSIIMANNPPGIYYIQLSFKSGASGQIAKIIKTASVGFKELDNQFQIKLFPNPITDRLNLEFETTPKETELIFFNAQGQIVYMKKDIVQKQELDLSFLSQGIYYLKIKNNLDLKMFKFIKK